jgi:hypothetical protein
MLAGSDTPTPLTQKNRAAARPQNNGTAKPKRQEPISVPRTCKRCGEIVPKERRVFCSDACRIAFQAHSLAGTISTLNGTEPAPQSTHDIPTIDAPALLADFTLEDYYREIAPALARVPVAVIRRATGLSRSYCKLIRQGKVVPHRVHWAVLRVMVDEISKRH